METYLIVLVGVLFALATYLFLNRSIIGLVLGTFVLSNATHLLIFVCGRLTREVPPLIGAHENVPGEIIANPLPQALILTAIVISFALSAFIFVLAYRAYESLGTVDSDGMRVAEPELEIAAPLDVLPVTEERLRNKKIGARP